VHANARRVESALRAGGASGEIRELDDSTRTAAEAAAAGTPHAVFPTSFDELVRLSAGRAADVAAAT
jgi:hypothetical protein